MDYLVTWIEGEEVVYFIVDEKDLCRLGGKKDKNCIITQIKGTH
ncbi:MAG: hypothetical protein XD50_0235 [Clostridia bacterium 41_269]|nr:MAG: hypothetical protein XD50_0235 [Clostridia bacterium 41_269]